MTETSALVFSDPPYASMDQVVIRATSVESKRISPGRLTFLSADATPSHGLEQAIRTAQEQFPATALILCSSPATLSQATRLARWAGALGVRAVLLREEEFRPTLRQVLTRSKPTTEDVMTILSRLGVRLHRVQYEIARLIGAGLNSEAVCPSYVPASTINHRLASARLPSPLYWKKLGSVLRITLVLQRESRSVCAAAQCLGYLDEKYIQRVTRKYLGYSPLVIAGTLGWEWVVAAYIEWRGFPDLTKGDGGASLPSGTSFENPPRCRMAG